VPFGIEDEQPNIAWFKDEPLSATSHFVMRLAITASIIVSVALVIVALVVRDRIVKNQRKVDLDFAALVALAPMESRAKLILADNREGVLWEPGLAPTPIAEPSRVGDSNLRLWRSQVRNVAIASTGRHFVSTDPQGTVWWHATARTIDDHTLVVSRRRSDALGSVAVLDRMLALAGLLLIVAVGAMWLLLTRQQRPDDRSILSKLV